MHCTVLKQPGFVPVYCVTHTYDTSRVTVLCITVYTSTSYITQQYVKELKMKRAHRAYGANTASHGDHGNITHPLFFILTEIQSPGTCGNRARDQLWGRHKCPAHYSQCPTCLVKDISTSHLLPFSPPPQILPYRKSGRFCSSLDLALASC